MISRRFAFAALLLAGAQHASAQNIGVKVQIRPRVEWRNAGNDLDALTTMRSRVDFGSDLSKSLSARLQFQDVRTFGAEASTTATSPQIDLHQAYFDLGAQTTRFGARVGRQEVSLGEERLVGISDWGQAGRAFDGVKGRARIRAVSAQAFLYQIGDKAVAGRADEIFSGLYATAAVAPKTVIDAYLLRNDAPVPVGTHQNTYGSRAAGTSGAFSFHAEAALQSGSRRGQDVSAWMATARAGVALRANLGVQAMYDELSGDADTTDNTVRAFDTLYGTNHKFYGIADVFTDIPAHTARHGLRDIAVKLNWTPLSHVSANLDLHQFDAAKATSNGSRFGREIDAFASCQYSASTQVSGGVALFDPGPAFVAIARPHDNRFFSYLMMSVNL